MSLRSFTQSKILARLAAQDREEQLQRRQAQVDAANRLAGLSVIDRLTGAVGQIPGMIESQQEKTDKKLIEEAMLAADVEGLPLSATGASPPSAAAALPERMQISQEEFYGGAVPSAAERSPFPAAPVVPIVAPDAAVEDVAAEMAAQQAASTAGLQQLQIPTTPLTVPSPEAAPQPRAIETGAQPISPPVVTRREQARAAVQKITKIPEVKLDSPFPTANQAHDRAMALAKELATAEPFMARKLQAAAAALRAEPEVTANLEAVEAALADAERIPTMQIRAQTTAGPVAEKTDEKPKTAATQMYKDKTEAVAATQIPAATATPVRRFASTIDEQIAAVGIEKYPVLQVDARAAGNEIVDRILAGEKTEPNSIAGTISRFLGNAPTERGIRIARLAATRRVQERQVAARKEAFAEAEQRVRLDEQRSGVLARARTASPADYAKYRDMEQDGAVSAIIGRHGDKLMAAAKIDDPEARARAVQQILTIDVLPATELNTADEIVGRVISDLNEFGEDFIKARKTKEKEEKPLEVQLVKELATMRTSYKDLDRTASSAFPAINAAMEAVSATGAVGRTFSQLFADRIKADPKAIAADAEIKRNIAAYLKATSGLATTDTEYRRIWASAPNDADPPDVYYAKLNGFLKQIAGYHDTLLDTAEESGRSIGKLQRIGRAVQFGPKGEKLTPEQVAAQEKSDNLDKELE